MDVGRVIEGGVSVSAIRVQNERPYSIRVDCSSSEESVFVCFVGDDGENDDDDEYGNGNEEYINDGGMGVVDNGVDERGREKDSTNLPGLQISTQKQGKKSNKNVHIRKNNRIVVG